MVPFSLDKNTHTVQGSQKRLPLSGDQRTQTIHQNCDSASRQYATDDNTTAQIDRTNKKDGGESDQYTKTNSYDLYQVAEPDRTGCNPYS